jgi:hypothetical protein
MRANSRADTADANVLMQAKVIQQQATESQAFSAIASGTVDANAAVDAKAETTVIEYREILRREKTCDYPVPLTLLTGCSTTRTVYVPGQCTPLPPELTKPVVPHPPAN